MSRISYNFYYPYNVFKDNAGINNISQKGRDFLLHKAQPFPSDNFMYIDGKTIIIVLSEEGLHKAHQKINNVILSVGDVGFSIGSVGTTIGEVGVSDGSVGVTDGSVGFVGSTTGGLISTEGFIKIFINLPSVLGSDCNSM